MKRNNAEKGFTLIETLLYVAIFGMLVGAITMLTADLQTSRLRAQAIFEVNDQGAAAIRTITQAVRNAKSINAPGLGLSSASLSLTAGNAAVDPIVFSVSSSTLYLTEASSTPIALTNDRVQIENFAISNFGRASTSGSVAIRFTMRNLTGSTRLEGNYAVDFYGAASIR